MGRVKFHSKGTCECNTNSKLAAVLSFAFLPLEKRLMRYNTWCTDIVPQLQTDVCLKPTATAEEIMVVTLSQQNFIRIIGTEFFSSLEQYGI